jgi:GNAT superfamily N-acetyltransferase
MRDLEMITGIIDGAADWLRTNKDTDQWARPWPSADGRRERISYGLKWGRTWTAWDDETNTVAATVSTEDEPNPKLWTELEAAEPAAYVTRLVVCRDYAGLGLGAKLLDWAGSRAANEYGARWIRIDVWTTNEALHEYYLDKGFKFVRYCSDPEYPSGALFQRPVTRVSAAGDVIGLVPK